MKNIASILIRFVGAASILLALVGYFYTYLYYKNFDLTSFNEEMPYYMESYLVMVGISLSLLTALLFLGFQFLALRLKYKKIFFWWLVLIVLYYLSISFFWSIENQELGLSIGAATGVANLGLVPIVITGFIVWAPLILYFSSKKSPS